MSHNLSMAERVALLDEEERAAIFGEMSDEEVETLETDWKFWGRPAQFAPEGDWTTWLIVAGRGFGKTRAGAEWVRDRALANPGCRIALVGRASSDTGAVMINGESGIMAISPPSERPIHKISHRRLEWPNGSIAETFSAEEPDQLRGPQFNYAWSDETAAWKFVRDESGLNAWDNLTFATRLGKLPQIIATTTPRRTMFMIEQLEKYDAQEAAMKDGTFDATTSGLIVISRGSTYDNATNLPASFLNDVTGKYKGTEREQQELLGLMLDEKEGALWTPEILDKYRWLDSKKPSLPLRIVAVDPSVAENPRDYCGIIVIGATDHRQLHKRHAFVLEDASVLGSPDVWAQKVIDTAKSWNASVVVEGTQGQALVVNMLRSIDPTVKVHLVQTGRQGKQARAEPVLMPYQQGRVHHWGYLEELETQLTTWDPEISKSSPDRLDALVHGITALLIKPPKGLFVGGLSAHSVAAARLPTGRGTGLSRATGALGRQQRPATRG